jgi:hypothetical protein
MDYENIVVSFSQFSNSVLVSRDYRYYFLSNIFRCVIEGNNKTMLQEYFR